MARVSDELNAAVLLVLDCPDENATHDLPGVITFEMYARDLADCREELTALKEEHEEVEKKLASLMNSVGYIVGRAHSQEVGE